MLRGRESDLEVLDDLVEAVRRGESRVLVVRGEPGMGKSALLEHAAQLASGCRVARAAGAQSEMELAFAALHQLCAPMLDHLERLPAPHRDALSVAFGLRTGAAPDRFLVGVAVLGLLSEVADEQPLVCLVDDAQWLDRESLQALEFVARRLVAESVGLVFGARQPAEGQLLVGLPELVLEGLADEDARALLDSVVRWPMDELVRDRIIAETRGNPLALLELPRGLAPAELAGGFAHQDTQQLSGRIEDSFRRRFLRLPAATRRLLLLAAAEPVGDSALLWRAAGLLEIGQEAADGAESEGLVEFGPRVIFRHPLVRSAIYRSASPQERREVHRALAEATDPALDPDRRAWQLAQATPGPDEAVALELERCADRARARGGLPAAGAFLERSSRLTLDPALRAARALAAARAYAQAGVFAEAVRCLATAEAGPLEELDRARVDLLRGQIAVASSSGRDAPALLLKAARRFEALDVGLARETYLEALSAAMYAPRFVTTRALQEVAEGARTAPAASRPRAPDLLLDGQSLLVTEGYAAAAPTLKRALSAFSGDIPPGEAMRWLRFASPTAVRLWDDESWDRLSKRHVELARDSGALGVLPTALNLRAGLHLYKGELAVGASMLEEARTICEATGSQVGPYASLALAAFRGREVQASELIDASTWDMTHPTDEGGSTLLQWASAVLYNSLGRYEDALAAAQRASEHQHLGVFGWALVELIEAGARSAAREIAAAALDRLSERTHASATDWALGIEARSRALLSEGQAAEHLYEEAIERLAQSSIALHLARAQLLYGEWLRRERRRTDAREQLRTAHEMFMTMGADGFAERARRELLATGETARKRTVETRSQLTPQETQVAQLARDGLSNPEIGARLFISPSTVQYHLRKVFMKLDINSRMQLARALPSDPDATR